MSSVRQQHVFRSEVGSRVSRVIRPSSASGRRILLLVTVFFQCGAPSVKKMMELRPELITVRAVGLRKEQGSGHRVSIVMMTEGGKLRTLPESVTNICAVSKAV